MKINSLLSIAVILLIIIAKASSQSVGILQFASARYLVNENAGTVTLVVERIGEPGGTAYVEYTTRDGTATNGVDYVAQSDALWFFGETNLTIVIPILNDAVAERDGMFFVTLSNPDPFGTQLGAVTEAVVLILDNDRGVEFSAATFNVDEGAGQAMITVRGGTDSTNGFSVEYATTDGCSATAGVDYLPQSGTLSFAAGETEKTFFIPIIDDTVAEGDETVKLRLSHPSGVELGPISDAVLRIRDNDPPSDLAEGIVPRRVGMWPSIPGGASTIAVAGNYAYLGAATFQVLDISDPANPRRVGECPDVSGISDMVVLGNYAYAAVGLDRYSSTGAVEVIEISDPTHPIRVGRYGTRSSAVAVSVSGQYGYVAVGTNGLEVLDLTNPANPQRIGSYADSSGVAYAAATGVALSGTVVYLAYSYADVWPNPPYTGLHVLDVSDPANPRRIGGYSSEQFYSYPKVVVSENHAYLLGDSLRVVDITSPANPQEVGRYYLWSGDAKKVVLMEGLAYVAVANWHGGNGLAILDLAEPLDPRLLEGGYTRGPFSGVAVSGSHAYVTGDWGMDVLDIRAPTNVARVGGFTTISNPNKVAVSGNYVYVADALAGLVTIDVTDAANPRLVSRAGTQGSAVGVATSCDLAFVASSWELSAFDLTEPSNPRRVGTVSVDRARTLAIEESRAYLAAGGGPCDIGCPDFFVEIVDLSDPTNPLPIGGVPFRWRWRVSDVAVSGTSLFAAISGYPGFEVFDVSDPANARQLLGGGNGLPMLDTGNSIHDLQTVVVSGERLFVMATAEHWQQDFNDGLFVFDIRDPANPQHIGSFRLTDGLEYFPGVTVAGAYAYITSDAGLEVIDIRGTGNFPRAATYPTQKGPLAVSGSRVYIAGRSGLEILEFSPPGIRPGSINRLADGSVQFTLNTHAGQSYTIQASTNLADWESLETRTAVDTTMVYTDSNAPNFMQRFYRAVSP